MHSPLDLACCCSVLALVVPTHTCLRFALRLALFGRRDALIDRTLQDRDFRDSSLPLSPLLYFVPRL